MVLADDRYAPVTDSLGFLDLPIEQAAEALRSWRSRLHGYARTITLPGGLERNIAQLEPLTTHVRPRELLVSTGDPAWTAYVDCGARGGDPVSTLGHLAKSQRTRAVLVTHVPHTFDRRTGSGRYGSTQLQVLGPEASDVLGYVRVISAAEDGGRWVFHAMGPPFDFEDVHRYEERRIRDRFTLDMLVRYCAELGLKPFELGFYPGPSALVTSPVRVPDDAYRMTLAQANDVEFGRAPWPPPEGTPGATPGRRRRRWPFRTRSHS